MRAVGPGRSRANQPERGPARRHVHAGHVEQERDWLVGAGAGLRPNGCKDHVPRPLAAGGRREHQGSSRSGAVRRGRTAQYLSTMVSLCGVHRALPLADAASAARLKLPVVFDTRKRWNTSVQATEHAISHLLNRTSRKAMVLQKPAHLDGGFLADIAVAGWPVPMRLVLCRGTQERWPSYAQPPPPLPTVCYSHGTLGEVTKQPVLRCCQVAQERHRRVGVR